MQNINYSNQLNAAREGTGTAALRTAGALQGMRANEQQMGIQQENHEAQQAQGVAEAAEAAEIKAKTIEGAELLQAGTSGEVAKFMAANPKIAKGMIDSAKFQNDESKLSRIKYAQDIIAGADPIAAIEARIAEVERNGGDASGLRKSLDAGDAAAIRKTAELDLAMLDPKGFLAYQKATGNEDGKNLTPKMRDFKEFQRLKKEDPEAAEIFGSGAGFIKDDKKRVFQIIDGMKVFADGTEKPLGGGDKLKTPDMKAAASLNQAKNVVGKAKEYQTKNVGFAMRLRDSIDGMKALVKGVNGDAVDPGRAAMINAALGDGTAANLALNAEEQQYMVNAKDALFAILRPETGAAITDGEMKQYAQIYLPQPGDAKGTTKLKERKLENQFRAIRDKAPRIYDATKVLQLVDKKVTDKVVSDEVNTEVEEAVYNEGQTATNASGQTAVYKNGQWVVQ